MSRTTSTPRNEGDQSRVDEGASDKAEQSTPGGQWHPLFPNDVPAAHTDVGQRILNAAGELLREDGFNAVTYAGVAKRARVNPSSIPYNFGSKAGLIAALVDSLIYRGSIELLERLRTIEAREDRITTVVDGLRQLIAVSGAYQTWLQILPPAILEPELRVRVAQQYQWWFRMILRYLGFPDELEGNDPLLIGTAEVVLAVMDGVAIQAALDPDFADADRVWGTVQFLLLNSMEQLEEHAAREVGRLERQRPAADQEPAER